MAAVIGLTFQVRVQTQKGDKVAISGGHQSLGAWNPTKVRYLKPVMSIHSSNLWSIKVNVPIDLALSGISYRYLVCRRLPSYHEDEDEDCYIIRHWESGPKARFKSLSEFGSSADMDIYGQFDTESKMFVDQGWLLGETEIQLRFYKDPIHMFKKHLKQPSIKVKCSIVNLVHLDFSAADPRLCNDADHFFDNTIHASNPLIRVSCFGKYCNKEQPGTGMSVSETDYVVYSLRTYEPDTHGIKIDFFSDTAGGEELLGYSNILPVHLAQGNGKAAFAINGPHGFPVGQVTVRYLIIKPCFGLNCDLALGFSGYWRERAALDIGHRGIGDTHGTDLNTPASEDYKHENTIGALQKAVDAGADFVEMDVQLSKDKVPVVCHDFTVSILLRKKQKGQHRIHHIPVKELTFSHLQDLKIEYAKEAQGEDQSDDVLQDALPSMLLAPFPSLEQAMEEVDEDLGYFIELKYPQERFDGTIEDGIESYFERNEFLDPILKTIFQAAGRRRVILASFDPDICIMARLKQNKYPVMMLVYDVQPTDPFFHDVRTQTMETAVAVAKAARFLGLAANSSCMLGVREGERLLEKALAESLVVFVWGTENNEEQTRESFKRKGVHGVCYDSIVDKKGVNVFRAEHYEKIGQLVSVLSANLPPSPSPSDEAQDSSPPSDHCEQSDVFPSSSDGVLPTREQPSARNTTSPNTSQSTPEVCNSPPSQRLRSQSASCDSKPASNGRMSTIVRKVELSDFY